MSPNEVMVHRVRDIAATPVERRGPYALVGWDELTATTNALDDAIARAEEAERVLETVGKFALHRSQLAEWVERRPQLESYEEWRIVYDETRNVVEDAENEMLSALAAYDAQRTEDDGE